jgi:hypothetical protein
VLADALRLMTARYQYRLRGAAEEPINSKSRGSTTLGLPTEHPTVPSLLKKGGLPHGADRQVAPGLPAHLRPLRSGYDEFFGPMSGGVDYFTHCSSNGQHDLWFGEEERRKKATSPTCCRSARSTTSTAWPRATRPRAKRPSS